MGFRGCRAEMMVSSCLEWAWTAWLGGEKPLMKGLIEPEFSPPEDSRFPLRRETNPDSEGRRSFRGNLQMSR